MSSSPSLEARDELARRLELLRAQPDPPRIVLANGCFDVLHAGHVGYLEAARSLGDLLVVALNADATVRAAKGPGRPLTPLAERAAVVAALRWVDAVTWFDETTLEPSLRVLRPDVHAKGTDYTPENLPEGDVDRELGIEIAICGPPKERSSTDLARGLGASSAQ